MPPSIVEHAMLNFIKMGWHSYNGPLSCYAPI